MTAEAADAVLLLRRRRALRRAKNIDDVVIWNEANSALFWRPQQGAARRVRGAARRLLRRAAQVPANVNVITSTSPHENPARFLRDLGAAYRASGRTAPIFDTFGHNAYPETTRESPFASTPTLPSLDQGDYVRLMQVLTDGVRRHRPAGARAAAAIETPATHRQERAARASSGPVTIWYLEDGFETVVPADKRARYTGKEPNRQLVQALVCRRSRSASSCRDQASQLRDAVELAYCQPAVGAFFNFQFVDEVGLGGWQSGLLWADGTPKPSYEPVKSAVRGGRGRDDRLRAVPGLADRPSPRAGRREHAVARG